MSLLSRSMRAIDLVIVVSAFCAFFASATTSHAQLLYSFETDLQGWAATGYPDSDFISMAQSTSGATVGTHSMMIETGPTFGYDVRVSETNPASANYQAFNAVAANLSNYSLDFDITLTADSWAHITSPGAFFLFSVAANSAPPAPNFPQAGNITPPGNVIVNSVGQVGTFHASIPMTNLPISQNSGYYQLNIGTNSAHTNGPGGEGVRYFIDNIHFQAKPQTIAETLFSWETPDNPATATVDERFEGWTEGFQTGHTHSIVASPALGPTDGTHALNIHRVDLGTGAGFTWGSQFVLAASADPQNQQRIDTLTSKIQAADRVVFDVTFDPSTFDGATNFARFGLSFSDTGHFYQAEFPPFDPSLLTEPKTMTMDLPLSAFTDASTGVNLATTGFVPGTTFFRITMSTNVNGLTVEGQSTPIELQVDNFRLLTEVTGIPGDYNNDGFVNAADYVAWRKNNNNSAVTLPNDSTSGTDPTDYAVWRSHFGEQSASGSSSGAMGSSVGGSAVPEPSGMALLFSTAVAFLSASKRKV